MKTYEHITAMENIMVEQEELLRKLKAVLNDLEQHQEDCRALAAYYCSDQREQDLQDDEQHLIPEDLRRGVLSEDGIYNFLGEYYQTGIRMMELALKMIKI